MRYLKPGTPAKLFGVLGAAALLLAACGDDDDDSESDSEASSEISLINEGTLTVCTDAPYEPFEFEDDDGTWTGFDMDLMREIANRMELDMDVVVQPFEGIWLAPAAGNCDIVASAMTINDERAENALFSDGYFEADQSLLVPAESAGEVQTLDDLDGATIGVQSGTTGQDYANANAPDGATVEDFDDEAAIFAALDSGDVQAVLQDLPVNGFRADESDSYEVAETYETGEVYGFATTFENQALIDEVNAALADIREDGTWDALFEEWIPEEWYAGAEGGAGEDEPDAEAEE